MALTDEQKKERLSQLNASFPLPQLIKQLAQIHIDRGEDLATVLAAVKTEGNALLSIKPKMVQRVLRLMRAGALFADLVANRDKIPTVTSDPKGAALSLLETLLLEGVTLHDALAKVVTIATAEQQENVNFLVVLGETFDKAKTLTEKVLPSPVLPDVSDPEVAKLYPQNKFPALYQ